MEQVFHSLKEIKDEFFPNHMERFGCPCCPNGYHKYCMDCNQSLGDRYLGEPKMMRCPECFGKHSAKEAMVEIKKGIESI